MRRLLGLLCAAALGACATVARPTAGTPDFSNSDAIGRVDLNPPVGTVTRTSGSSGGSGSGGAAAASPVPTLAPGGTSGKVAAGPNGSVLVPVAEVDARKVAGKTYNPLEVFEERYLRWERGTFKLAAGARDFTANEAALLETAIVQLNAAIGRSVFSYGGVTSGDIPISNQDVAAGTTLGFALFVPQQLTLETAYLDTKVVLNLGNLQAYAPDGSRYADLFKTVALHELGHVAGLDHNPQAGTLMNATTESTPIVVGFSQSELDALRLLYGP